MHARPVIFKDSPIPAKFEFVAVPMLEIRDILFDFAECITTFLYIICMLTTQYTQHHVNLLMLHTRWGKPTSWPDL